MVSLDVLKGMIRIWGILGAQAFKTILTYEGFNMEPVCKNSMKIEEMLEISKNLLEYIYENRIDPFVSRSAKELDFYLNSLSSSLQFYANKNYDNGLVARMALGQMTQKDSDQYKYHANNTRQLDCDYKKF